jgi:hypothetical protein
MLVGVNSNLHTNKLVEHRKMLAGYSARLSSVVGAINGLIVVKLNGEGRGVSCRVVSQNEI